MERWRHLLPLPLGGTVVAVVLYGGGALGNSPITTATSTTIQPSLVDETAVDPVVVVETVADTAPDSEGPGRGVRETGQLS